MRDVPERESEPPVISLVALCPLCGGDELGENVIAFRVITDWLDGEPYKFDSADTNGEPSSPRFYCQNCGDEFDEPLFEKRVNY